MNIVPWKSKEKGAGVPAPVSQFRSEFDRLLDRFFSEPWSPFDKDPRGDWMPSLDMTENDKEVTVKVEVPGLTADDIQLQVSGDLLTISGEKQEEIERKEDNWYHSERRFGSFRRTVQLPGHVDADKVTADYDKGVLVVHLPRDAKVKARKVAIRAHD